MENVIKMLSNRYPVRRHICMSDIETCETVMESGGWEEMSFEDKAHFLWSIGFDTKNFRYTKTTRVVRGESNIPSATLIIEGAERLDEEWLTMRVQGVKVASDEAQTYVWMKKHGDDPAYSMYTQDKIGM